MQFYGHPFSSYCQKALIAFYENDIPFEFRLLTPDDEETAAEHARLWPLRRMPVLVDGDRTIVEASIIVEYLGLRYPARIRLLPADPAAALEVRMLDRFFDNYVMTPMQRIVFNCIRAPENRDPYGDDEARRLLDVAYDWRRHAARPHLGLGRGLQSCGCAASRLCSMPTGCIRLGVRTRTSRPIGAGCCPDLRSREPWTRPDRTARCFRPVRRIVTDPPSG